MFRKIPTWTNHVSRERPKLRRRAIPTYVSITCGLHFNVTLQRDAQDAMFFAEVMASAVTPFDRGFLCFGYCLDKLVESFLIKIVFAQEQEIGLSPHGPRAHRSGITPVAWTHDRRRA